MRNIAVVLAVPVAIGAVVVGAVRIWRRHPKVGTAFVNSVEIQCSSVAGWWAMGARRLRCLSTSAGDPGPSG